MSPHLKPEERELYKLVNYFKKRAEVLIIENKLGDEYKQMLETCDKLMQQVEKHAESRANVLAERELLKGMVRDNAKCPKCSGNTHLKVIGFDTNPKGWKSNKYKCRKCNISFVWNAPNNPWDMIPYVEQFITDMELKIEDSPDEASRQNTLLTLEQMRQNIAKLKPIVDASDLDMKEMEERDKEMGDIVHKFKKHLMIEKIRLED